MYRLSRVRALEVSSEWGHVGWAKLAPESSYPKGETNVRCLFEMNRSLSVEATRYNAM